MGLLWSRQAGYSYGLWLMLVLSSVAVSSLVLAQKITGAKAHAG